MPQQFVDQHGVSTSKRSIAQEVWHSKMSPAQRLKVMESVTPAIEMVWYGRCLRYLEENMIEYSVTEMC